MDKKENAVHSFLMIGQSNMAGRGYVKDVKPIYDEHIKMLVNGRWQTMTEPINYDRPTSGIGLAASFAGAWRLKNENIQIGLIPCAEGGTSLNDWEVGGPLFDNAVFQAKLAQRISLFSGFLWHQGENDSFGGRSFCYFDGLDNLVAAFRKELQAPDVPFIAGGLGDFLSSGRYGKYFAEYNSVNQALLQYADKNANSYFVSASDLSANADGLHFDAISQRRLGVRYFEAFNCKKNVHGPLDDENELIDRIQDKPLTRNEKAALLEISFARGDLPLADFENQLSTLNSMSS